MRTQIIISTSEVEKLKQKARNLKKVSGTPHHVALDQVALAAGFNHWHHVSESAKAFKPTEQAYFFGVIIAMDIKDAMDFRDPSGRFVEDETACFLCADDIYQYIVEGDDDEMLDEFPRDEEDKKEWMMEDLMNYAFFRFALPEIPDSVEDVVKIVRECSFWPPEFIWYKGAFQESPSNHALDEDGNIVGIRF